MLELDRTLTLMLNGSHSLLVDGMAWTATQTTTWLPLAVVLLYVVIRNNELGGALRIIIGIALSILVADQVASSVFKPLVARFRPTNDPQIMYLVDVVRGYRGGQYGFFSSHAANTFAVATFVSLAVRSRSMAAALFSWALLNCWSRVYLGVHYVGDLTVGAIWGALTGYAFYRLLVRRPAAAPTVPPSGERPLGPTPFTPYSPRTVRVFVFSLLLTCVYVLVRALFFIA